MARKIGEIELDLRSDRLQVFQHSVNSLTLQAMYKLLSIGLEPPRVNVVRSGEGFYRLRYGYTGNSFPWNYGGHHRAVARKNWNGGLTPFPCNLYNDHIVDPNKREVEWIDLNDVRTSMSKFDGRFFRVIKHLPKECLADFCAEIVTIGESLSVKDLEKRCPGYTGKTLDELRKEKD